MKPSSSKGRSQGLKRVSPIVERIVNRMAPMMREELTAVGAKREQIETFLGALKAELTRVAISVEADKARKRALSRQEGSHDPHTYFPILNQAIEAAIRGLDS